MEDGVFGKFLNKQKKEEGEESRGRAGSGPTWKLRQWTKGKGYQTVVLASDEVEGQEEKEGESKMEDTCTPAESLPCKENYISDRDFEIKELILPPPSVSNR